MCINCILFYKLQITILTLAESRWLVRRGLSANGTPSRSDDPGSVP